MKRPDLMKFSAVRKTEERTVPRFSFDLEIVASKKPEANEETNLSDDDDVIGDFLPKLHDGLQGGGAY